MLGREKQRVRSLTQGRDDNLGSGRHMRDVAREWGTRGPSQGAAVLGPPCPLATGRLVTVVAWPREQPYPCLLGALVCS